MISLLRLATDGRHGLCVLDDVPGIILLRRRCDRHQRAAIGDDREQRDHEFDPVVEHHDDVVAGLDLASEIAGEALAAVEELLAGDGQPVLDDQHRAIGILDAALVDDLDDVLLRYGAPLGWHVLDAFTQACER